MGLLRKTLPYAFPMGRVGVALWAWKNRDEIARWAGYAVKSAPKVLGDERNDVFVEGKLRARLTGDHRTRGVDGLRVDVQDGVATLSGMVDPDVHDAVLAIATNTGGVTRVRDEMTETRRRGRARAGR
jgi:osmotically-inducible protein OsmY